jgi:NAD(P)-dependent dehydrogenase (short-subunit alcohol dehydrogenase family)
MRNLLICLLLLVAAAVQAESTVLITGSNRGIGLGLVKEYASHGWKVIATCRNPDQADELHALAKTNQRVVIEQLDVTIAAQIEALAVKYHGQPIDVLINNAGLLPTEEWNKSIREMDFEYARRVFEVNTFAPLRVMQAFLDQVAASQEKKIVNISSGAGSFANPLHVPHRYVYRASKAALNMFTFDTAEELGKSGITSVVLHPGVVYTQKDESIEVARQRFPGLITVEESAAKIFQTIAGLTPEDNGTFLSYEPGQTMSW